MIIGKNKYNSSTLDKKAALYKESIVDIRLKRARKKAEEKGKINFGNNISYNSSSDMILLANTDSIGGVRGLQNSIRAQIKIVRASGADQEEIKKIVRQMEGVIRKAEVKIQKLSKEKMLQEQKLLAHNSKMKDKIDEQIKKSKKARKAIENSQIVSTDDVAPGTARDFAIMENFKMQNSSENSELEGTAVIPEVSIDVTVDSVESSEAGGESIVDATV